LEGKFWSLLVDECTDRSKVKFLAIVVQFYSQENGIECFLYRLVECSDKTDSDQIFDILNSVILTKPFGKTLAAFASDGAAVMRGKSKSVLQNLKQHYPKTLGYSLFEPLLQSNC